MAAHSTAFLSPHAIRVDRALHARLDDCQSDALADTLRTAADLGPPEPAAVVLATAEHAADRPSRSSQRDGPSGVGSDSGSGGDSEAGPLEPAVALGLIDLAARVHASTAEAPGAPTVPNVARTTDDSGFEGPTPQAILSSDVGFALGFGSIGTGEDPAVGVDRFGTLARTMSDVTAGVWQATEWDGESVVDIEHALSRGAGSLYATALVVGLGNAADEELRPAVRRVGTHLAVAVVLRRCEPLRELLDGASLLAEADRRADDRAVSARNALAHVDAQLRDPLKTVLDGVLDGTCSGR